MEAKVYKQDGKISKRKVSLDSTVFDVDPNDHVIWLDVRAIQAAARQGTHKAKERAEVAGSTRKLYRQKGTGNARAGSAKSPIRKSGGTIFGPRPRAYVVGVNRKTKQLARRSALSYKAREDKVFVIEAFSLDAPATRSVAALLSAMEVADKRVLLLTAEVDVNVYKSGRNLPRLTVRDAASASTLDVIGADVLVIQEQALDVLSKVLGRPSTEPAEEVQAA